MIPVGSKVALKNGPDAIYNRAWVGSEGFVRQTRTDEYGYEEILIEWDKNDWRYNNQANGWAFASHFDVKQPPLEEEEPSKELAPPMPFVRPEVEDYMDALQQAMEAASGAEGFVIFIVTNMPHPEIPDEMILAPAVFSFTHSSEADAILGMSMMENAAEMFNETSMTLLSMQEGFEEYAQEEDDIPEEM
jgi:hypothetical protein